ncbi:MAG: helix-turn-helix domain-containing protein [Bacteroidales bacterium]|nr:helix-turn-helix domain-containing protein [Bacteroidales bacterium]
MSCVKEVTGLTAFEIGDYVLLVEAKEQLLNTGLSMKEISNYLGFSTQSTFTTWFKRLTGVKPSDYRKINLNN